MLFEEMVKIKREEMDSKETDKMFEAIHRQAYFNKVEAENKRILANLERAERKAREEEKKAKKQERKEVIIDRIKYEAEIGLLLVLSAPVFFVLFILAIK